MTSGRRVSVTVALVLIASILVAVITHGDRQVDSPVAAPVASTAVAPAGDLSQTPTDEIPSDTLQSALSKVCAGNSQEPDTSPLTGDDETQAQFEKRLEDISERLSVSSTAEHLHVAALLTQDTTNRIALIDRAISLRPTDPFLLWRRAQLCAGDAKGTAACSSSKWERQLLEFDGQNSETWHRVAANRYMAGEVNAALEAMRFAATAADTRIYWTETIEMVERGLAAGSEYNFSARAFAAFGLAASQLPRYSDLTAMCFEQSKRSADWAHACIRYGQLAENQARTEIGVSIGRSIQKVALEALGEANMAADVEHRIQSRRRERSTAYREQSFAATERFVWSDPALFAAYMAAIRSEGEVAAQIRIAREVSRLLESQPELACE